MLCCQLHTHKHRNTHTRHIPFYSNLYSSPSVEKKITPFLKIEIRGEKGGAILPSRWVGTIGGCNEHSLITAPHFLETTSVQRN